MKLFSSKRRVVTAAALVLLALFLLRPGASRLKSRIISSLSAGVGRSVDLGSVHVRLLPRPGFDLENLVVYDDPAFGAEPMLRAGEVTADLRLTSLLRGKIEIARLNLTEPSLNLVHNDDGQWNVEALLERTSRTVTGPTAKAKSGARSGFPYIEATSARINFKRGQEKKPYALTNADFSLWQESENAWGVRLKAQPIRTDLNLNDTGLLQVSGTWQRAETLHDTPLQFSVEWSRAQLGQVTKLFTGNDKGWRGGIVIDVALTGTPAQLKITSTAAVDDFRRYDITTGKALRLATACDGEYSSLNHEFHGVNCNAPIGKGFIALAGDFGIPGMHHFVIDVTADKVPASALVALAQHAKKNLPDDVVAEGTVNGRFTFREDASRRTKPRIDGQGEISGLQLASASNGVEIGPETIPFLLTSGGTAPLPSKPARTGAPILHSASLRLPASPHIEIGPITAGSATARMWVDRGGYDLALEGEIEIGRTLRLARMIGLPVLAANPEGSAQVNLQIAGAWIGQADAGASGFIGPQVVGVAKLRNVKVAVHGVGGPVEIVGADMQLLADAVRVEKLNLKGAGAVWTGSLETPRGCKSPETCPVRFALKTDEANWGPLNEWAHPSPKKRAWYQVLEGNAQPGPSWLSRVRGTGSLSIERFRIHSITATNMSAKINLGEGKIEIAGLNAELLSGRHRGTWQIDFSVRPAICRGKGDLVGISLASLASAMRNPWIAGSANGHYDLKGSCSEEFWPSAEGVVQADMRDGVFEHVIVGDDGEPLRIRRLDGQARMHGGSIEVEKASLDSREGTYELSGTATLQREIAVRLTRIPSNAASGGYSISGTLAQPVVTPLGRTEQAKLKRLSAK